MVIVLKPNVVKTSEYDLNTMVLALFVSGDEFSKIMENPIFSYSAFESVMT